MEEIEVDVISYNKKMEKSGLVTCYFGLLILLTNLIPGIWEFAGMFIVSIGMLPIIIGALLINYNSNKIQKIGSIRIGERKTFINNYDPKEIINSEYKLIFSKNRFPRSK